MMAVVWALTNNPFAGAMLGVGFFAGREHSQAEYKAINTDFGGKRANMPWHAGFNPKYWSLDAVLDLALPIVAMSIILFLLKF